MKFLVLAGTRDGRLLAEELRKRGHPVVVSTLTEYGAEIVLEKGIQARHGALDEAALANLLQTGFTAVVDATHPYALRISELARLVCAKLHIPYFRWQRESLRDYAHPLIHWVKDIKTAARQAAQLGNRILLTTGSNSLPEWLAQPSLQDKVMFVRVLPTSQVLARCESLGLKPSQIIAAQGPFSQAWNEAVCEQLNIEVVIAKDSGKEGGTTQKIQACLQRQIPIILLERQEREEDAVALPEFIDKMEEKLCKPQLFS